MIVWPLTEEHIFLPGTDILNINYINTCLQNLIWATTPLMLHIYAGKISMSEVDPQNE